MFRSSASFDKLLDKATSHLLLEPDWTTVLQICDNIRQGDIQSKYAVAAIKKKILSPNPHVVLLALQVLESCVKNCGASVHQEVANKTFLEDIGSLLKNACSEDVKSKLLELIQVWAHVFRNESNYSATQDMLKTLKSEGYQFPTLKETDAMFSSDQAPEWAEGSCCHRCRVQFTLIQRKHHCRNCGQVFCQKCSSRNLPIPQYGLEKEVRVCDTCWEKLNKTSDGSKQKSNNINADKSKANHTGSGKTMEELIKEEERQLALALAQSESESLERQTKKGSQTGKSTQSVSNQIKTELHTSNSYANPELDKYLNRSLWEQKQQNNELYSQTTAGSVPSAPPIEIKKEESEKISQENNIENEDIEEYISQLQTTLEIFVNRMKSNLSRNRPIVNDTYVQSLFINLTNMHAQLMQYTKTQDQLRVKFEGLQDKLAQVKDARAALGALREEHEERRRKEAEEAERQRQIQLAQKLEVMRKKKQEYLKFQHQLAIQKMQEQEREMHFRQEQQMHKYTAGPFPLPSEAYSQPQHIYMPPPPQHYSNVNQSGPAHNSSQVPYQIPYGMPAPSNNMIVQHPYSHSDFHSFQMQGMPPALGDNGSIQSPPQTSQGHFPAEVIHHTPGTINNAVVGQEHQPVEATLISFP